MRPVVLSGVFFIAWFLTIFCLLPIALGSPADPETGAPLRARLGVKFLIATVVAVAITAIFYGTILIGWVDI